MSRILVTGASGFIGQALAASLSARHEVLCMSRKNPNIKQTRWVRGEFGSFEDLRQLDATPIDVVVHLAAVTGGCLERDGILVNVEGTRCLMRYLMDHGCKRFVNASSIAVVGMQNTKFRPLTVPIPDEHPCLDRDGYGFSKYMMEEVTRYYHRQNPEIDVINLRLSSVIPDGTMKPTAKPGPATQWCLGGITLMERSDAVRVFTLAAEAAHRPGVRILNAAGPRACVAAPVAEILKAWWGKDVDVSHFQKPGHEYDSVYDVSLVKKELGFVAERLPVAG